MFHALVESTKKKELVCLGKIYCDKWETWVNLSRKKVASPLIEFMNGPRRERGEFSSRKEHATHEKLIWNGQLFFKALKITIRAFAGSEVDPSHDESRSAPPKSKFSQKT